MAKREYSRYQSGVIGRYYENLEGITLQKLQELVTELYLAEGKAKEDKLWERAAKAMEKLKVKPAVMQHILVKRDVKVLAMNIEDWLRKNKQ